MTFQEASFKANDDRGMPQSAWSGAFNVLVREIEKYHGAFRASRYRMHKEICDGLLGRWGDWHTVLEYDIAQREAAVADPRHDLGLMNNDAMTGIMADPAWRRLHFAAPVTPAPTATAKRAAPVLSSMPAAKRAQTGTRPGHCFRCGAPGHLPSACTAESTITGIPCAARAPRGRNGLLGPNGPAVCFKFASGLACAGCAFYHGCTLCGETGHGAGKCPRVQN